MRKWLDMWRTYTVASTIWRCIMLQLYILIFYARSFGVAGMIVVLLGRGAVLHDLAKWLAAGCLCQVSQSP